MYFVGRILCGVIKVANGYPNGYTLNKQIDSLNAITKGIAEAKNIPFVEVNSILAPNGYLEKEYAQNDFIHLTGAAYLIWAKEIKKAILFYQN